MWRYTIHRTRDGRHLGEIFPKSPGSWSRRLSHKGSGTHVFQVQEDDAYPLWSVLREMPASRLLVVSWEDPATGGWTTFYAGAIRKARYHRGTRTITLSHMDIWSIWDQRFLTGRHKAWYDPTLRRASTYLDLRGNSLSSWAKKIVEWGMTSSTPELSTGQLPIRGLDGLSSGGYGRRYWTYEFTSVSMALDEIQEQVGGAVIDFTPRVLGEERQFTWNLEVRTSYPRSFMLNAGAPKSAVTDLSCDLGGLDYANEVNVTGEGSEASTMYQYRWAGDHPDRVMLAALETRPEIEDDYELVDAALGIFQERRRFTQQIEATVRLGREDGVNPDHLVLGARTLLHTPGDPVLGDGPHELHLIGLKSAGDDLVTLEFSDVDIFVG